MILETFKHFKGFELLDSGRGYRLERWGQYTLARPDPQAIWQRHLPEAEWEAADATFTNDWRIKNKVNKSWPIEWENIKLLARLTPFKHTGIFAEQAANWEWMTDIVQSQKLKVKSGSGAPSSKLRILNLFGYTGAASVVLAKAGCFVTHVDASKPSIALAKENQAINKLPNDSIRWILDDAAKFAKRELKRGAEYDGILMDPPAFGHSPTGKTWKFAEDFPGLLHDCVQLLSPNAQFVLINAYATNSSAISLQNTLEDSLKKSKDKKIADQTNSVESGELCLSQRDGRLISTGIFARWTR